MQMDPEVMRRGLQMVEGGNEVLKGQMLIPPMRLPARPCGAISERIFRHMSVQTPVGSGRTAEDLQAWNRELNKTLKITLKCHQ